MTKIPSNTWFEKFLQNQLITIVSVIFIGGVVYNKFDTMMDDLKELKVELKLVRELDKRSEAMSFRMQSMEEWKRSMEEWKKDAEARNRK